MSKRVFAFVYAVAFTAAVLSAACIDVDAVRSEITDDDKVGKVVLIVADHLNIGDINNMDFLGRLASESYLALVNNRQLGRAGAGKSKLVIGSGKRLEIGANMTSGGSAESFRELYSMESGRLPKSDSLVYTDIHKLYKMNNESEYRKYIGYLGETIRNSKGSTCFLGNSDAETADRSSMLIAMDSKGEIDLGETEDITKEDRLFPYGRRTDYKKLAELYKQYLPASSFIVIETGDMGRLEVFKDRMSEDAYKTCRDRALADIDSFVEDLVSYGDFKTLIFISTYPSKSDVESGNKLTPVVAFDMTGGGVLYSGSTRREGLILNTDLSDYILYKLGFTKSSAVNKIRKGEAGEYLETMNRNILQTSLLRLPVLTSYAVMMIAAIILLFITAVFSSKEYNSRHSWLSSLIAYTMVSFPLILLYLPTSLLGGSPAVYAAFAAAASLSFSLLLHICIREKLKVLITIGALQLTALISDIIAGSPFIKQSVLGYDPVIGARFYGIGNEYAGIFIGCSLFVIGCFQELSEGRLSKANSAAYFVFCAFILGQPLFGANFGGMMAAASGYILAFFLFYGIKFSKRNLLLGILVLCGSAALIIATDSLGAGAPSHMGSLVRDTETNGAAVIISTIQRKIAMNLRLIKYTIWTKVLICMIAAISIMFYRPVRLLKSVFTRYRYMKDSWICLAVSAIVGFAVNDSGIVLAATAMVYVVFTMLLICIGERNES